MTSPPLRVLVVSSQWPSQTRPDVAPFLATEVRYLERMGIGIEREIFSGARDPRNYAAARRTVESRLKEQRFDVVHAHFAQSALVVPRDIPFVLSLYSSDLLTTGLASAPLRYVGMRGAARADLVIVGSQIARRKIADRADVRIIPPGVDLDVFRPAPQESARLDLRFSDAGRLVVVSADPSRDPKRLARVLEAGELLRHETDVDLVVLPRGPEETVARYLNAGDALVVAADGTEDVLAIKQALACDLPVVALPLPDAADVISGVAGCAVCDDETPATIAATLRRTLDTAETFIGRSHVARYDETVRAEQIVRAYHDVMTAA